MNEFALLLALLVVLAHVVTIFWPRKPLQVAIDKNGLPILWRNDGEQSKDIACVWGADQHPPGAASAPAPASISAAPEPTPVASFSKAVTALETAAGASRQSAA